ncbi:hypothetical protein JTB14_024868 [Gonioctena quinquepunctata]|nr:hypothetical protein JTB14_024868 [Gonioctena quinquepunctata]
MQLPPVRGRHVSQQPEHKRPATHSWRLFSLVELTENMRQQEDTTLADILNTLRVQNVKSEYLEVLLAKISTNYTESIITEDINETGGLPSKLKISEGAKIMLRANTDVEKGLVNGKIGFISEVISPHSCREQMYDTDIPN